MTQLLLHGHGHSASYEVAQGLVTENSEFRFDPWPGRTSGYVVDTVQTVFDAFFHTASFEECLINVVNRGGDADTTGALAGQLAGAHYGLQAIPGRWLKRLDPEVGAAIRRQAEGLLALAHSRSQSSEIPSLSSL